MNVINRYVCPCCKYRTLTDGPGRFEICEVCYWEDDNIQRDNPDYTGGANDISLNEARNNYKKIGAMAPEFCKRVRLPTPDEKN